MLKNLNPFVRHCTRQWLANRQPYEREAFDFRLIFCLEDELTVMVDKARFTLSEDGILIIPPATPYNLLYASKPQECFCGVIDFELTPKNADIKPQFPYPVGQRPKDLPPVEVFPPFDAPMYLSDAKFARKDVEAIINLFLAKGELYTEFASVLLKRILLNCIKNDPNKQSLYSPLVTNVFKYITHYYYQPLSNEQISKEMGYASGYVNTLFRKETGMSIHEYLIQFRLKRAARMLREEDASICEISNRCGFASPAHFTKMFRRAFGATPKQYRKNENFF